ncbi:MAG: hypothetical protein WBA73_13990 [Devosia sp.]
MTTSSEEIRAQVKAAMLDVALNALRQGLNGEEAILAAFPGTPPNIALALSWEADGTLEEEWWQAVERTIDLEVIKQSVALVIGGGAE